MLHVDMCANGISGPSPGRLFFFLQDNLGEMEDAVYVS